MMFYTSIGAWLCFMFVCVLGRREFKWYQQLGHAFLAAFVYFSLWLCALSGM